MPVPRITKEDLKQRLDVGDPAALPVIVDARLKYPYEHSAVKLPGAVRLSPQDTALASIPSGRDVVVYDSDPDEVVSAPVAAALLDRGYKAAALKGGIAEWMAANFPTEPRASAAPEPAAAPKG